MSTGVAILNKAPDWLPDRSDYLTLWHGCTSRDAATIQAHGIDLTRCRADSDFGQGFYLTSIRRQARHWAWFRYFGMTPQQQQGNTAQLLRFRFPRVDFTGLKTLCFVLGDYNNLDFWSLVQHCRISTPVGTAGQSHHRYPGAVTSPDWWYDVVIGPVSAFWTQRVCMNDSDQFSFHTPDAID
jgi:hypothetical protein